MSGSPEMNVAFKVTWVYGEDGPWTSPCKPEGRRINILKDKETWCSRDDCPCCRRLRSDERLPPDEYPCLDYPVFQRWPFGAGVYHSMDRDGEGIPMKRVGVSKFALLTSRPHGTKEHERVIIGCYRIDRVQRHPDFGIVEATADTDSPYAMRVPVDRLGSAPRYWDFRPNHLERSWGSGLFRHLPDGEARDMRMAVAELCDGIAMDVWSDVEALREEEQYLEGQRSGRLVSHYERDPRVRARSIGIHGTVCQVCGFDFGAAYGEHGEGYIEVHHLRPLSDYGD